MAIKKATPLKADPNVIAEHFQLAEIQLDFKRKVALLKYELYSNAQTKSDGRPRFEIHQIGFTSQNFPFEDGQISNSIIDEKALTHQTFQGGELVADV